MELAWCLEISVFNLVFSVHDIIIIIIVIILFY